MMILAVDAGGTHCRLALITNDTTEIAVSGAANATSNLKAAAESICAGLETLAVRMALPAESLTDIPAYLGVAGVTDSTVAQALQACLPLQRVRIEGDRNSALRGALGAGDGFVVHCGTGSFFATQKNKVAKFAGGWGPVLDDLSSAHWLAVQALRLTLYAEDKLESHSELTESLLSEFGSTAAIVAYARDTSASDIASISKAVTHHASLGDTNAITLMSKGAVIIDEKLQQLGCTDSDAVCLTGGIAPHYKPYLSTQTQHKLIDASGEPLDGAIALAKEFYQQLHT